MFLLLCLLWFILEEIRFDPALFADIILIMQCSDAFHMIGGNAKLVQQ